MVKPVTVLEVGALEQQGGKHLLSMTVRARTDERGMAQYGGLQARFWEAYLKSSNYHALYLHNTALSLPLLLLSKQSRIRGITITFWTHKTL
jgi:hypothetical protein